MNTSFNKMLRGYHEFRKKYASGHESIMQTLSEKGQNPHIMVVACCDARVDPALILNCHPGDLFVTRNVANIVPPCEKDNGHHGTSAALEFGVCSLNVKHLILLGHSQCGGIRALLNNDGSNPNDFINSWVSIIKKDEFSHKDPDEFAKTALQQSYANAMTFPWILDKIAKKEMIVHLWFFDIKTGQIFTYSEEHKKYMPLDSLEEAESFDD